MIRFGYHICEDETVALDDRAELVGNRMVKHRPRERERMELAVLAARIDGWGQIVQQRSIEDAARKGTIELSRIDARESRLQACRHHFIGEFTSGFCFPERKDRLEARTGQPGFAIAANI